MVTLTLTRRVVAGIIVSYLAIIGAFAGVWFQSWALGQERAARITRETETALFTCARANRSNFIIADILRARLRLEPPLTAYAVVLRANILKLSPVDCFQLPVFNK